MTTFSRGGKTSLDNDSSRPLPVPDPDWSRLIAHLEDGMKGVVGTGNPGKDFQHYVFEEAMAALYGPDVWDWWNRHASY